MTDDQKQTYVKKQLTQALLSLMNDKPLKDITIRELTEKAQVARVSFYRSYRSKEEILKEESDRLIRMWGEKFETGTDRSPSNLFPSLFEFFRANRDFYMILFREGLAYVLLETIRQTLGVSEEPSNTIAYLKSFWAYGIYGWMIEWMRRGMPESGDELYQLLEKVRV